MLRTGKYISHNSVVDVIHIVTSLNGPGLYYDHTPMCFVMAQGRGVMSTMGEIMCDPDLTNENHIIVVLLHNIRYVK